MAISASANDIISSAMRLIGVLASGEVPSAAEGNDAFAILNQMLDSWTIERLMIFTISRQVFSLNPGQQTYQMGTGAADFNVPRPDRIERAGIISLANPSQPLELPLVIVSEVGWAAIPVKGILSALPQKLWNDYAFPLLNLNFWPIPSVAVNVALYTWTALTQFPDLVTAQTFPPGYLKALRYNLAVDLAPEFGRAVPPEVAVQALMAKAAVKSLNAPHPEERCDEGVVAPGKRVYNWLTDLPAAR